MFNLKSIFSKLGVAKTVLIAAVATVAVSSVVYVALKHDSPNVNAGNNNGDVVVDDSNLVEEELDPVLNLKSNFYSVEYGEEFSVNPADYLQDTSEGILSKLTCKFTGPNGNEVTDITSKMPLGDYSLSIAYLKEEVVVTISVKDTHGPEITLKSDSVEVKYGAKYDPKSNVLSVTDVVDGELEYSVDGEVNTSKSGDYTVTVKAYDANDLYTEASFTVTVGAKPKSESTSTSNSNATSESDSSNVATPTSTPTPTPEDDWGASTDAIPDSGSGSGSNTGNGLATGCAFDYATAQSIGLVGNTGMVFSSYEEANAWANAQVSDPNSQYYGKSIQMSGFVMPGCSIDNDVVTFTVSFW